MAPKHDDEGKACRQPEARSPFCAHAEARRGFATTTDGVHGARALVAKGLCPSAGGPKPEGASLRGRGGAGGRRHRGTGRRGDGRARAGGRHLGGRGALDILGAGRRGEAEGHEILGHHGREGIFLAIGGGDFRAILVDGEQAIFRAEELELAPLGDGDLRLVDEVGQGPLVDRGVLLLLEQDGDLLAGDLVGQVQLDSSISISAPIFGLNFFCTILRKSSTFQLKKLSPFLTRMRFFFGSGESGSSTMTVIAPSSS